MDPRRLVAFARWWFKLPAIGRKIGVLLVLGPVQFFFLFGVAHLGHPSHYLGIEGAGGALFGVIAAILAGPWVGLTVGAIGTLAYFVYLTDLGQSVDLPVIIVSSAIWLLAAYAAGLGADVVRRRGETRERALAKALDEAVTARTGIERVAHLAPAFYKLERSELPEAICRGALSTFESSSCSLHRLGDDGVTIVAATPITDLHSAGRAFSRSDLPGLVEAAESNDPEFEGDVLSQPRSAYGEAMIRSIAARSVLRIPVNVSDRVRYLVVVGWQEPNHGLTTETTALARRFADQVAVALERAEVDELHSRLEERLLPRSQECQPGVEVTTRYRTGEQRLGIGGDYVDFICNGQQGLDFVIGDVSGKGPDAAALGATLRSSWRALALTGTRLEPALGALQELLESERRDEHVFSTIVCGHIDAQARILTLASAGHPAPIMVAESAEFVQLIPSLPLGFHAKKGWEHVSLRLPVSWSLVCFTDGLYEGSVAPGSHQRFGLDRLLELVRDEADYGWIDEETLDRIIQVVEDANGRRLPDDLAVLLLSSWADRPPVSPTGDHVS